MREPSRPSIPIGCCFCPTVMRVCGTTATSTWSPWPARLLEHGVLLGFGASVDSGGAEAVEYVWDARLAELPPGFERGLADDDVFAVAAGSGTRLGGGRALPSGRDPDGDDDHDPEGEPLEHIGQVVARIELRHRQRRQPLLGRAA